MAGTNCWHLFDPLLWAHNKLGAIRRINPNRVLGNWYGSLKSKNSQFSSPSHLNNIIIDFKDFVWKMVAMHHLKIPAKYFCITEKKHVSFETRLSWDWESETVISLKTNNSVIFNGGKNTTNGVYQHHFNYLIIYLFRQLRDLLWQFLSFLGPNQPMYTQFQLLYCRSYQINAHRWPNLITATVMDRKDWQSIEPLK